ncbi:MAG: fimbrillin family protein [Tidjanibacter sp.]|nr:fimbrillin family protein [Tidjanibacter sp.]
MKKIFYVLIAATLLIVGCENSDNIPVIDDAAMRIEVLHPSATRATETSFEDGDVIGLFVTEYIGETASPLQISGNWANNVATTFEDALWTPAKKVYWSENKMDVYGYYPYMKPTSIDEQLWSVQLDQSTPETTDALSGYEASDFLWAKAEGVSQEDGEVQLQFKHICSKLVVKLVRGETFEGDFPDNTVVYLHSTVPTATMDFEKGIVSKDIYGEVTPIKAKRLSSDTFEVILIPQSIQSRLPFVEIEMNGIAYMTYDLFSYLPGVQYSVSITLNSSPEQIEVEIGGNIENWE